VKAGPYDRAAHNCNTFLSKGAVFKRVLGKKGPYAVAFHARKNTSPKREAFQPFGVESRAKPPASMISALRLKGSLELRCGSKTGFSDPETPFSPILIRSKVYIYALEGISKYKRG